MNKETRLWLARNTRGRSAQYAEGTDVKPAVAKVLRHQTVRALYVRSSTESTIRLDRRCGQAGEGTVSSEA